MKKITIIALLFATCWQVNAQKFENPDVKRLELKIDAAHILAKIAKIEFEYWLNDWSSVGAVGFYNFGNGIFGELPLYKAKLLGTYRLYFGKNPMQGFFLEGSAGVVHGNSFEGWILGNENAKEYTAFGAGIAIGWKWFIPNPNITLDITYGLGRLFQVEEDVVPIFFRYGHFGANGQ